MKAVYVSMIEKFHINISKLHHRHDVERFRVPELATVYAQIST